MTETFHTSECVMSHIWMNHFTHVNESCHTYECVVSHTCMSHVKHEWVTSHIWMSHVTCMKASRHVGSLYRDIDPHICWKASRHVGSLFSIYGDLYLFMNESFTQRRKSCHTYEWVTSLIWMSPFTTHMGSFFLCKWGFRSLFVVCGALLIIYGFFLRIHKGMFHFWDPGPPYVPRPRSPQIHRRRTLHARLTSYRLLSRIHRQRWEPRSPLCLQKFWGPNFWRPTSFLGPQT